jgi:hypothetical protein
MIGPPIFGAAGSQMGLKADRIHQAGEVDQKAGHRPPKNRTVNG